MSSDDYEKGIEIANEKQTKSQSKIPRLRRWLYIISIFSIAYLRSDFEIRFSDIGNGDIGFTTPWGMKIIGLTQHNFQIALLFVVFFLIIRFSYFSLIYWLADYNISQYKSRVDEVDEIYDREMKGGLSKEEERELLSEQPEMISIWYALRLKFWWKKIGLFDDIFLPFIVPFATGVFALCYLYVNLP